MAYSAELSRSNPTALIFLIDQSQSMSEPFGVQAGKPKADGVAEGINRLLQNLVLKCAKSDGIRDYFQVGVLGYGPGVRWALRGKLAGRKLVPISDIANCPLRVEQRTRETPDGAGGLASQRFRFPIWFEPIAAGPTPMCHAFAEAAATLEQFIDQYPGAFPPLVINISDGKATDGNPEPSALALQSLETSDGNVLVFNAHLSSRGASPIEFPSDEEELPDAEALVLFRMSSLLPATLRKTARSDGFAVNDRTRGFVYNADLVSVIRFLDIGTRASQLARRA